MARRRETDTARFPEYEWLAANALRLRMDAGLSQAEVASRMGGIDQSYVSAVERMQINATLEVLSRLSFALNCSISELLTNNTV